MWDAETVGQALVQAFITLAMMPRTDGHRRLGDHWPTTMVEWADQLAQAELEESERRTRQQTANRIVIHPSTSEITQMETAFDWLRELRSEDPAMSVIVSFWASRTAQGRSIKRLIYEKKWTRRTFFRKRAKALLTIARTLNARAFPVFRSAIQDVFVPCDRPFF
jgi:hypothetical protein